MGNETRKAEELLDNNKSISGGGVGATVTAAVQGLDGDYVSYVPKQRVVAE